MSNMKLEKLRRRVETSEEKLARLKEELNKAEMETPPEQHACYVNVPLSFILSMGPINGSAVKVFLALLTAEQKKTFRPMTGIISQMTGIGNRHVRNCLEELEEKNMIRRTINPGTASEIKIAKVNQ